jgi:hypothetical protein
LIFNKLGTAGFFAKRRLNEQVFDAVHSLQHGWNVFNASGGNHGGSDDELGGHCCAPWPRGNCLVESLSLCAMLDGQGAIDEFFSMVLKAGTGTSQSVERIEIVYRLGDKIENLIWKI